MVGWSVEQSEIKANSASVAVEVEVEAELGKKQAFVSLDVSNWYKIHQIHDSDNFQLKIRIPDKDDLFATLGTNKTMGREDGK